MAVWEGVLVPVRVEVQLPVLELVEVIVVDEVRVGVAVWEGVLVPVRVEVQLPVLELVEVILGVTVRDADTVPVRVALLLSDEPVDKDAVNDAVTLLVAEDVDVADTDFVALRVAEVDAVIDGVTEGVPEGVPEFDGVTELEGVTEGVPELDGVTDGVFVVDEVKDDAMASASAFSITSRTATVFIQLRVCTRDALLHVFAKV